MSKIATTKYNVIELIKKRWSPRSFSNEIIPEEILLSLFEAASWSASSRNEQPWRFIYGKKGEGQNYDKIFNSLVNWNQKWANTSPILGIGLIKTHFENKEYLNTHAQYDLGQAMAYLSIQAISSNIYIHQMGGFDKDKAIESFNISHEFEPVIAFAMGYLGKISDLPDEFRELEQKQRLRFDLKKILFPGDFNP
jgi:nitroreductase